VRRRRAKIATLENLKKLLRTRGLTQAWLARSLGVNDVTVSRWVTGHRRADLQTLRSIATLLRCEIEEITGGIDILTDEERRVLAAFRNIPDDKREALWTVIRALTDDSAPSTSAVKKPVDKP